MKNNSKDLLRGGMLLALIAVAASCGKAPTVNSSSSDAKGSEITTSETKTESKSDATSESTVTSSSAASSLRTSETVKKFTVTWKNYDGKVLETDKDVEAGTMPEYNGATPTRAKDKQFTYDFSGWTPELTPVATDVTYTAEYSKTLFAAYVTFDLDGGMGWDEDPKPMFVTSIKAEDFPFDIVHESKLFIGWEYNGTKVFDEEGNQLAFPEIAETMVFKALYKDTFEVTVTSNYEGIATIKGDGTYHFFSSVEFSVTDIKEGYIFESWKISYYHDGISSTYTVYDSTFVFKAEYYDLDVKVNFTTAHRSLYVMSYQTQYGDVYIGENPATVGTQDSKTVHYADTVTVNAVAKADYSFAGWFDSEGTLVSPLETYEFTMPNKDYTLFAKWNHFEVRVSNNGGGYYGNTSGAGFYSYGETVTLRATTVGICVFLGWFDATTGELYSQQLDYTFSMPAENIRIEAKFEGLFSIYVENDGGGYIEGASAHAPFSTVTLSAHPYIGYEFAGWYRDGVLVEDGLEYTFKMPAEDVNLTVKWNTAHYNLTLECDETQGTVKGSGSYYHGENAKIEAIPNEGYEFFCWTTDGVKVHSTSAKTSVCVTSSLTLTAIFSALPQTLTVNGDTTKGTFTESGTYNTGETVQLEAAPNEGYEFAYWLIDGKEVTGAKTTFTMPGHAATIEAVFVPVDVSIELVQTETDKGLCSITGSCKYGETVTVSCTAEYNGYEFNCWVNADTDEVLSYEKSYQFKAPLNGLRIKPTYYDPKHNLKVSTDQTYRGTVTSTGVSFRENDEVTVTATPYEHYKFEGWYMDDEKVSDNPTCTLSMPNEDLEIKAKFGLDNIECATNPTYIDDGSLLTYGLWPKSIVSDYGIISTLDYYASLSSSEYYTFEGERYVKATVKSTSEDAWFKCEAITWKVLATEDNKLLLLSENILDQSIYNEDGEEKDNAGAMSIHPTNHNPETGKDTKYGNSNWWFESFVRNWCYTTFYNSAFSLGDDNILVTEVTNNVEDTYIAPDNTFTDYCQSGASNDKVFLPSYAQLVSEAYGFSIDDYSTRAAEATDYAEAMGVEDGRYWTRSGGQSSGCDVVSVYSNGAFVYHTYTGNTAIGCRPAMWITLAD